MLARGYKPKVDKPFYTEYRPPEVLERVKDKFAFSAMTVEHTPDESGPENFRRQVSGIIGENIRVEKLASGDTGLFGKAVFYTKDGWEYYNSGNKETSADYRSVCEPDPTGKYDMILRDIISVNGVVLTARGRGGSEVRVLDSAKDILGGFNMAGKKNVLSFLFGGSRAKDDGFKLSSVVLDGAKAYHTLDSAGKETLVADIMGHVTDLGEGQTKELLIGAIKDSLNHPVEALTKKDDVARVIDGLYDAAIAADEKERAEALAAAGIQTQDAKPGKKDENDGKAPDGDGDKDDVKAKETKDSAPSVDELVDKAMSRITDSIDSLIDKKVKEALGVRDSKTQDSLDSGQTRDGGLDEMTKAEGAFLLEGAFGI